MIQRSGLAAILLAIGALSLSPHALAQAPVATDDTRKPVPPKPPEQSARPPHTEEQLYQKTKETIAFFEKDLLRIQDRIALQLVGRECEPSCCDWGCDRIRPMTRKDVEEPFVEFLTALRQELNSVEAEHRELLGKPHASACLDDCKVYYVNVATAAQHYWVGQAWLTLANHVLSVSVNRVNTRVEAHRQKLQDDLARNAQLSDKDRDAALASFDRKASLEKHAIFSKVAREFQSYVHLLGDHRKTLIQQLWRFYDLADDNHFTDGRDIMLEALRPWDKRTLDMNGFLYLQPFVDMSGEPLFDWCKKPSFPEIEARDSKAPCSKLFTDIMEQPSISALRQAKGNIATTMPCISTADEEARQDRETMECEARLPTLSLSAEDDRLLASLGQSGPELAAATRLYLNSLQDYDKHVSATQHWRPHYRKSDGDPTTQYMDPPDQHPPYSDTDNSKEYRRLKSEYASLDELRKDFNRRAEPLHDRMMEHGRRIADIFTWLETSAREYKCIKPIKLAQCYLKIYQTYRGDGAEAYYDAMVVSRALVAPQEPSVRRLTTVEQVNKESRARAQEDACRERAEREFRERDQILETLHMWDWACAKSWTGKLIGYLADKQWPRKKQPKGQ